MLQAESLGQEKLVVSKYGPEDGRYESAETSKKEYTHISIYAYMNVSN